MIDTFAASVGHHLERYLLLCQKIGLAPFAQLDLGANDWDPSSQTTHCTSCFWAHEGWDLYSNIRKWMLALALIAMLNLKTWIAECMAWQMKTKEVWEWRASLAEMVHYLFNLLYSATAKASAFTGLWICTSYPEQITKKYLRIRIYVWNKMALFPSSQSTARELTRHVLSACTVNPGWANISN